MTKAIEKLRGSPYGQRGFLSFINSDETEPKECVYHFVYHCDRELRLAGVSNNFEQQQNPLI